MKTTNEVVACVVDKGIFLPIAQRLARDFKKVYYYSPWEKAFPSVHDIVGDGFDDVERVKSFWQVKRECDLFVFPDVGFEWEQNELIEQGIPVWGARGGDRLELSRGHFLDVLGTTDLPMPKYERVLGLEALRSHLKDKSDKWIKISNYRGDFETMHFRDWAQDELSLDSVAVQFGPWKDEIVFYVFDPIETTIEDGCDTYCIDGQWPSKVVHGMESKDKAFLCAFQNYADLPEELRKVNEAFSPILKEHAYGSFFSSEVRITEDGTSFFIDPTCRAGSPPSQVQTEMIANYGDIVWHGARGELVDPEPVKEFGVQALLTVKCPQDWNAVSFPEELRKWVKCGFASQINDALVFAPDEKHIREGIGWLTSVGDSPKEAIEELKEHAKLLPDGVTCSVEALANLLIEAEEAKEQGVTMTQQPMPDPAIVLDKSA